MSEVWVSLKFCDRCRLSHSKLVATPFDIPPQGWTHWVACPTNGQPVLVVIDPPDEPQTAAQPPESLVAGALYDYMVDAQKGYDVDGAAQPESVKALCAELQRLRDENVRLLVNHVLKQDGAPDIEQVHEAGEAARFIVVRSEDHARIVARLAAQISALRRELSVLHDDPGLLQLDHVGNYRQLLDTAKMVLYRLEHGDLAEAVRELDRAVCAAEAVRELDRAVCAAEGREYKP